MDNFFPEDVNEAAKALASNWISAAEFEAGTILQISAPMEKLKATNPKYGADDKNYLVQKKILAVGETFRYHFKTPEGVEKQIDSTSAPLFIGMRSVEEIGVGDWVKITRTGKTSETRFAVEKVAEPVSQAKNDVSGEVPF